VPHDGGAEDPMASRDLGFVRSNFGTKSAEHRRHIGFREDDFRQEASPMVRMSVMTSASMIRNPLFWRYIHRQYVERVMQTEDERNFEQQVQSDAEQITSARSHAQMGLRTAAEHMATGASSDRDTPVPGRGRDNAELRAKLTGGESPSGSRSE